ncbi:Dam family site-specific DNA-(adenine-N6)-methyltransferase [Alicyclobacillus dauci]|uniref:Site-specific DNA-methyltransferase (adenine-specific) n=1 Tax=Alicyclobacillus dauci TaxID=1475485 RepID=A0ABY6Z208_9BACL|nr:Dam family site-specific DNA-(adenine-N6)-methyltransferase [Alicyclobacillus dauci]WAH36543.1 Dam family site-specific DNA-(adenine-N6)-methyltransferase [Alicyclobacillus dauci]
MKPFLKWAGSKYRVLPHIRKMLPESGRIIEPFCGSCAVSLNVHHSAYVLNDSNADLICLYETLRDEGAQFIAYCRRFFTAETNCPDVYYRLRAEYNQTEDKRYKSALFLYLNRHAYNGLYRTNLRGDHNVPFGRYRKPYFPEREMTAFYERFHTAQFLSLDFETVMRAAQPGDVIYADPPYVPLSNTANFTSYQAGGFNLDEQRRLARVAEEVANRGVPVLVSNHATEFTKQIYRAAEWVTFDVQRNISRDASNRGRAREILALFRGESVQAWQFEASISGTAMF